MQPTTTEAESDAPAEPPSAAEATAASLEELKAKAAGGEELTDDELAQMQVPYL